jgi:hypothetical protein
VGDGSLLEVPTNHCSSERLIQIFFLLFNRSL